MAQVRANPVITELRERISHLEGNQARRRQTLPFGVREIDDQLPGGGLSFGAIHEFAGGGAGTVDGAAAALLAAGIAARTKLIRKRMSSHPWRKLSRSAGSGRSSPNSSACR
jgi:protein ImuA